MARTRRNMTGRTTAARRRSEAVSGFALACLSPLRALAVRGERLSQHSVHRPAGLSRMSQQPCPVALRRAEDERRVLVTVGHGRAACRCLFCS